MPAPQPLDLGRVPAATPPSPAQITQLWESLSRASALDQPTLDALTSLLTSLAPKVTQLSVAFADSPVTLAAGGILVFVDATLGNITIRLPEVVGAGDLQTLLIKRTDAVEARTVTILPAVADAAVEIEGDPSRLLLPLGSVELSSDNTNWWVTRGDPAGDEVVWIP